MIGIRHRHEGQVFLDPIPSLVQPGRQQRFVFQTVDQQDGALHLYDAKCPR